VKPGLLRRLDVLAAIEEMRLSAALGTQMAALAAAERGDAVLVSYRDRLAGGWRGGAVVSAAQAQRAQHFADASRAAGVQLRQAARSAVAGAATALAQTATRRRILSEHLNTAARADAAADIDRAARDRAPTALTRDRRTPEWT
jgi:hypothetical protein